MCDEASGLERESRILGSRGSGRVGREGRKKGKELRAQATVMAMGASQFRSEKR